MEFLNQIISENTLLAWSSTLLTSALVFCILKFIHKVGIQKARTLFLKFHANWAELIFNSLQKTNLLVLIIIALYCGSRNLMLPPDFENLLKSMVLIALFLQAGFWGSGFINAWTNRYRERQIKINPAAVTTVSAMRMLLLPALWVCILLLIMDNLGINITTLVAGLGIGGVAVALATQNILGDLFASLSIVMDKTFLVGDFIELGEHQGTVEYIGMKSTRIRSISGEQIIFSNSDLLGGRIRNYGRMFERRVQVNFKLSHTTKQEHITLIPELIKQAVEKQEKTRLDRAHFWAFDENGLWFEYVYFITSAQFNVYMDTQQKINIFIRQKFESEGIEFFQPMQNNILKLSDEDREVLTNIITKSFIHDQSKVLKEDGTISH
jgi:small-conductance mechanosensitive channel